MLPFERIKIQKVQFSPFFVKYHQGKWEAILLFLPNIAKACRVYNITLGFEIDEEKLDKITIAFCTIHE